MGRGLGLGAASVLMTALAGGAARAQDAADETRQAYDQLARHVEAMERASGVHSDLTALVLQGGLTSGRWALVHAGASGVGTASIQIAKAVGARIGTA